MKRPDRDVDTLRRARFWLIVFLVGLVLSGVTAFPLTWELRILARILGIPGGADLESLSGLRFWIATVWRGLVETDARFPFLAYGTDWLAFGHLAIGVLFLPAVRDPVRMRPLISMGLWVCALVIPLALVCGPIRGIPFYWRLIDCAFGVVGAIPLVLALGALPPESRSQQRP